MREKQRWERLDDIGYQFMQRIANLIPKEKHGYLSDDPEVRAQVIDYPWDARPEGKVGSMNVR